ncbi:MAG: hypothetical protein AAF328_08495 [Planctomycetota bacterium]
MRYWITTQWPSPSTPPRKHRNIFLPNGREAPGKRVQVGDRVAIFELKTGRSEVVLGEDGPKVIKARADGAQGIVTIGEVTSPVKSSGRPPSTYTDDSEIWWRWKAETGGHNDEGFVPTSEVTRILGFASNYGFRGFGEARSGLKEISGNQFLELAAFFASSKDSSETESFKPPDYVPPKYGPGGEGAVHKALKQHVADYPELVFQEKGLKHIGTEVVVPSGDRIDVLLRDQIGRYVAVEVEPAQGLGQLDGLCQAVKYRHLACVLHRVDFEAGRSALVAFELHESLDPIAKRYAVEMIRVDRSKVAI